LFRTDTLSIDLHVATAPVGHILPLHVYA